MYATGTWEPGPQLGAGEPTDATSELVVMAQTNGIYRLVELATGRELAQLEDPEQNDPSGRVHAGWSEADRRRHERPGASGTCAASAQS